MSSRPQFNPESVITNGDMSGNIISKVTIVSKLSMIGYDISWAGATPIGAMSVQVSNTYTQNGDGSVRNPGTWTTVIFSTPTPVTGNTGNGFIDVDATGAFAIRLVYTRTSGNGLMNAVINAKVS